jgi:hypothetical protein
MMKNLTLTIDEELLRKARVLAAMKRTSVNEMVRTYLDRVVREEQEADEVTEALLKLADESTARMGDWRPGRAETYSGHKRFDP